MVPKSARLTAAVAILSMLVIAVCDAKTNNEVSLWQLYVLPVTLVSQRFSFVEGGACAACAGALLMISAFFSGHPYANNLYFVLATVSHFLVLALIAWYASRLAASQALLKKILQVD